ncbi:hypothetical protein ACG04R_12545 [Roseateles sp. BYS78W]|uniref:Uncharacterized protein n=1 Tax=Pelomonas candidula TaxID=3299025 RepID=A0ABW7HCX3_9BURK
MHTPACPPSRPFLSPLTATLAAVALCISCGGFSNANAGTADVTTTAAQSGESLSGQTPPSSIDRLKAAIDDMALPHELKPAGGPSTGWGVAPLIIMGTEPYSHSIPSNWVGTRHAQWKSILTWFVIYEGAGGNQASNSAVEINGIELWYLSTKDKIWKEIQSGRYPQWHGDYDLKAVTATTQSLNYKSVSKVVATFAPTSKNIIHGGLNQTNTPWNDFTDTDDISALFATVRHRLVLKDPNGEDDRGAANYTVQAGIDYYPYVGAKVKDLGATYMPGAGVGRFIKVKTSWQYSTVLIKSKGVTNQYLLSLPPPALEF